MTAESSAAHRARLVRELEARGVVRSAAVRDALLAVPRERFVAGFAEREGLEAVYRDDVIVTKQADNGLPLSSSSQPAIMAAMLELLALEPGQRVLEIGAGTGYNAALLRELVGRRGRVHAVELDREVAAEARGALRAGGHRAQVAVGDGRAGLPKHAPYDRIVVTASSPTVCRAWFDQLAPGGIVEVPLRLAIQDVQVVVAFRKTRSGLVSVGAVPGGFMPLRSQSGDDEAPLGPLLMASDLTGPGQPALRQLHGETLPHLSGNARRRLLATALGEGRRRPLGVRADPSALVLFAVTALPASRIVGVFPPFGVGVIGRDGRSLATLERPAGPDGRPLELFTAYGGPEAEELLERTIRRWLALGRPGVERLELRVSYDGDTPRLRSRWRKA